MRMLVRSDDCVQVSINWFVFLGFFRARRKWRAKAKAEKQGMPTGVYVLMVRFDFVCLSPPQYIAAQATRYICNYHQGEKEKKEA
jgi:hypothetical protein